MTSAPARWIRRAVTTASIAAILAGSTRLGAAKYLPWRLPKLRRIRVHDHYIAYYETGSGPPVVLIHGGSGSPALEWGRVMIPLSRKFRVIAPYSPLPID